MSAVYLDHNATTPLRPEAREAMLEALDLDLELETLTGMD